MDINRLLADELEYELRVRGASHQGTVDEKRTRLRSRLQFEKLGGFSQSFSYEVDGKSEITTCQKKISEIRGLIDNFNPDNARNEKSKVTTRTIHIVGRLNRITEDDLVDVKDRLIEECTELMERLEALVANVLPTSSPLNPKVLPGHGQQLGQLVDPNVSAVNPQLAGGTGGPDDLNDLGVSLQATGLGNSAVAQPAQVVSPSASGDNSKIFVTITRWGIFFDGTSSLTSFITRIEELRSACGIAKPQLLRAAVILFRGSALSWYRAFGESANSWDELVLRLRHTYLSSGYEEELWKDIRSRTQHSSEKAAIYIAVMENYFNLFSTKPSERRRVEVIRGNLLPHMQEKLAATEARVGPIDSLAELVRVCQYFDDVHARARRYRPPPTNPNFVVEPGLMFREQPRSRYRNEVNTLEQQPIIDEYHEPESLLGTSGNEPRRGNFVESLSGTPRTAGRLALQPSQSRGGETSSLLRDRVLRLQVTSAMLAVTNL